MSLAQFLVALLVFVSVLVLGHKEDKQDKKAASRVSAADTVGALVYGDNYFEFYVDGKLVKQDPLGFTPHNAIKFSFETDTSSSRVYAIKAKDWADTTTGFEYMSAYKEVDDGQKSMAKLGSGALRVLLSDGVVSSSEWKCFTMSYGPTDASIENGCSNSHFSACRVQNYTEPDGWKYLGFNDKSWKSAVEYSDDDAGWGLTPLYDSTTGQCSTRTDPISGKDWNPPYLLLDEDDCLDPKAQDWGSSVFIWQGDLEKDNTVLCRIEVSAEDAPKEQAEINKKQVKELKQEIIKEKKQAVKADAVYKNLKAEIKENKEVLKADKEALGIHAQKKQVLKIDQAALGLSSKKSEKADAKDAAMDAAMQAAYTPVPSKTKVEEETSDSMTFSARFKSALARIFA